MVAVSLGNEGVNEEEGEEREKYESEKFIEDGKEECREEWKGMESKETKYY